MIDDDASPNSASLVPVALAVLAVALGGAGLYFGFTASRAATELASQVEKNAAAAAAVSRSDIDGRLKEVMAVAGQAQRDVEALRMSMKMNNNRTTEAYGKLVERLDEIQAVLAGGGRPQAAAAAESSEPASGGRVAPVAEDVSASGTRSYQIKGGDTFQRIANEFGISVQAIIDANPDVNPRRLSIGQVIQLPEA